MKIITNTLSTIISTGDDPAGDHLPPRRFIEGISGYVVVEVTRDEIVSWGGCDAGHNVLDEFINANPDLGGIEYPEGISAIPSWRVEDSAGNESAALYDIAPTRANVVIAIMTLLVTASASALSPAWGIAPVAGLAAFTVWYMATVPAKYLVSLEPRWFSVKDLEPLR